MAGSRDEITHTGTTSGNGGTPPGSVQRPNLDSDLDADERDPSRIAPSAEGIVRFAGLPSEVRQWLADEIAKIGANGNGDAPQHGSPDKPGN